MSDEEQTATLRVGGYYSHCSACGGNADPEEERHLMIDMRGDGCGARFVRVSSDYPDARSIEATRAMRPDLPMAGDAIQQAARDLAAIDQDRCDRCGELMPDGRRKGPSDIVVCDQCATEVRAENDQEALRTCRGCGTTTLEHQTGCGERAR